MGIGLFGGAGGGLTGPAADGGTPTPVTPAWTMVTPAQWTAATETYSLSGALIVEPSDDPDWTFKTSFSDSGDGISIFELGIDMTPYIYDDRCTVLIEYGQRPNDNAWGGVLAGIRAGGEASVVLCGLASQSISQPHTRQFFQKRNVTTDASVWPFFLVDLSDDAWFVGQATDIHVGNATQSPTAWARPMGTATTSRSVWPAWLDPDNPRVGDFVGINQYWSPSVQRDAEFRVDAPRVPASAERKLVLRLFASSAGGPWNDWYHRVAIVNP